MREKINSTLLLLSQTLIRLESANTNKNTSDAINNITNCISSLHDVKLDITKMEKLLK
jgi:hypothetical protein